MLKKIGLLIVFIANTHTSENYSLQHGQAWGTVETVKNSQEQIERTIRNLKIYLSEVLTNKNSAVKELCDAYEKYGQYISEREAKKQILQSILETVIEIEEIILLQYSRRNDLKTVVGDFKKIVENAIKEI